VLESFRYLRTNMVNDTASVIDQFESHVVAVSHPVAIINDPQKVCELLVYVTFCLYALASELHADTTAAKIVAVVTLRGSGHEHEREGNHLGVLPNCGSAPVLVPRARKSAAGTRCG
jgi:hypothetical protein